MPDDSRPDGRWLQKDDLPRELWPLWDTLSDEIDRVRAVADRLNRARRWALFTIGSATTAVLLSVWILAGYR